MLSREMRKVADRLVEAPAPAMSIAIALGWQRTRASRVLRMLEFRSVVEFDRGAWRIHPESEYVPLSQCLLVGGRL